MSLRTSSLNYAPPVPLRSRIGHRTAIVLSIVVTALASTALWGHAAWHKVQLLYWQGQCLSYKAPLDRVVWSSNPLQRATTPVVWTNFYQLFSSGGSQSTASVFIHERVGPAGNRRLVAIETYCGGQLLVARIFVPGTLFSRPRERTGALTSSVFLPDHCTSVYAGQPDRSDSAHFTFRYVAAGSLHVIDGWLTDDDRVLLEERRGEPVASLTP
jgi:hypothetical protein